MNCNEPDKCQCVATTANGKRCYRIGQYSTGGGVLCTEHHRMAMAKKVNDKPIRRPDEPKP